MNHPSNRQFGGALPKVLLLIVFLGLFVGFLLWKQNEGVIGHVESLPDTTVDSIALIRLDGKQSSIVSCKSGWLW